MNKKSSGAWIVFLAIGIVAVSLIASAAGAISENNTKRDCESDGKIYESQSKVCREKTVSEKFDEKCQLSVMVNGKNFSCDEIRSSNLEQAYLNNKLVVHSGKLYEAGNYDEYAAGKDAGDYCLSASDTWYHIGETRCVAFRPQYFARSGNNYFIDEKKDYKNGFVVYMYGNYGWNWFLSQYQNADTIVVCGQITRYQGHPQIKTAPSSIDNNPTGVSDGPYTVYKYTCK